MRKPANAMELVDRYLEAVRFWLPKTGRQEEILAELGDDLRSQIEERESELGRRLENHELSGILKRCGLPMVVAARLGPKKYLIGPTLYPIYTFVLKMVLFWILVPVFVFIVGPSTLAGTGDWGEAIASTSASLWSGLLVAAGIITLVFAVLERTSAHDAIASKWDPLSLPPVRKHERRASLAHTVCELAFNWFGLLWLLLIPHSPALIFGPAAAFLTAGPLWHRFYLPIVLYAVVALVRSGLTLAKPQWTWFAPLTQVLQTLFGLIILRFLLNQLGHMTYGQWPFVTLTEAARNSPQCIRVAAIVNVSVLIGLAGCWLGFSIALVVHAWKFLQYVRKSARQQARTTPLEVH